MNESEPVVIEGVSSMAAVVEANTAQRNAQTAAEAVRLGVSVDDSLGWNLDANQTPDAQLRILLTLDVPKSMLGDQSIVQALCAGQMPAGIDDRQTRAATKMFTLRTKMHERVFRAIVNAAVEQLESVA